MGPRTRGAAGGGSKRGRWRAQLACVLLVGGGAAWYNLQPPAGKYGEWEQETGALEVVETPVKALMRRQSRAHEMELAGTERARPLLTKEIVKGLRFDLNVSRLVLTGKLGDEEATLTHIQTKDVSDLHDVLPRGNFVQHGKTCGLVGGSRRLLNENLGRQIDSMDAVMRFNEAPTKGYEAHVGRRTTFRALSQPYLKALLAAKVDRTGRPYPTMGKTVLLYGDVSVPMYIHLNRKYPENMNYIMGPHLRQAAKTLHTELRDRVLAIGSYASAMHRSTYGNFMECLIFLMQACETVHIFGVDGDAQLYYDKKEVLMTSSELVPDTVLHVLLRAMGAEALESLPKVRSEQTIHDQFETRHGWFYGFTNLDEDMDGVTCLIGHVLASFLETI